jgi:hypothetical protein
LGDALGDAAGDALKAYNLARYALSLGQ